MEYTSIIESKRFIHPNGLAFDFSTNSDITFLIFVGYEPLSKPMHVMLQFWKKLTKKLAGQDINVVFIADRGSNKFYKANYFGIQNVCDNVWELGKLLYDKMYLKANTKRAIVFADCGGTIPAILTSTLVPYHSLNMTTPYLTIIGSENEFNTNQYTLWHSRELSKEIFLEANKFQSYFDTLAYYDLYTQNPNNLLNLHWANNILGTDLWFRNRAEQLPKRPNLTITDHILPANLEGHNLTKHLWADKTYQKMIKKQLEIQKSYLGTVTNS